MYFYFLLYIFGSIVIITSGEYFVKESNPSYLYYKFSNIKEPIFPYDIRINISLSRILGILLYSIDRNMNQLILSLSEIMEPAIKIEFRKKEYYAKLSQLCGCGRCRYGIIDLRIQIQFNIFLQCNGRDFQNFQFVETKEVNDVYPLPYNKPDNNTGLLNEAQLWLVNHQQYKNVYPNPEQNQDVYPSPEQFSGCIFNVWYKDELVMFTNITDNIGRKCIKTCVGNVCNGGHCYEAFDGVPVCDCTNTFLNGPYCNDTIFPINIKTLSPYFKFNLLKISWISSSKNLLIMNNSNLQIQLFIDGDVNLIFEYKYNKDYSIITKGILSRRYIFKKKYKLIVYFLETMIHIQLLNNGLSQNTTIPTNLNIKKEEFSSVTLRSGDGYIDFYHKTPQQYTWRKLNIQTKEDLAIDTPFVNETVNLSTSCSSTIGYICTIIIGAVLLVASLCYIIYLQRKMNSYNKHRPESTVQRNVPSDTVPPFSSIPKVEQSYQAIPVQEL